MEENDSLTLTKVVWNQFKRSKDFWADEYSNIDTWDQYWNRDPDVVEGVEDWQDQIHVPLCYDAEQELTPRIISVITATNPPFDVTGVETEDDKGALAIKHLVGHQFELSKFDTKAIYYIRQAAVRGTTIAQVFYNLKERYITSKTTEVENVTEKDPITGEEVIVGATPMTRKRTKKTKIKNHPDFEVFSVKDAFPDPDSIDFDDELPFIRRQKVSLQKLKEWNKVAEKLGIDKFENLDKLEEEIVKKVKNKKEIYETQVSITLLHYWGLVDLSSYGVEVPEPLKKAAIPAWITIGYTDENEESHKGKHLMRAIRNPYHSGRQPFVKSSWIKKKTPSWFGIGICEAGQSAADRINTIVSLRIANIKRIINKRFKYNILDTNLDLNAAERGEYGIGIGMSDVHNSMEWEQIPDVTQSSYLEEKMAKDDFREATGASAAIAPAAKGEQHSTVRGMMLLQGQAGERLKPIAKDIEQTFNKELAQFYLEFNMQFMKDEEKFEVLGEDKKYFPVTVTPEQIIAKVHFRTTGVSEIVAREMQINQLLQFKTITMNDPTVNKAEINKRIAILFGFKDLDSLIRKLTPEQEAQLMGMMGSRGAQGAQGAPPMPSPENAGRPATPPGEEVLGFEKAEAQLRRV